MIFSCLFCNTISGNFYKNTDFISFRTRDKLVNLPRFLLIKKNTDVGKMIIASQKRKENIAEYLLYMWQIEDIIRANRLDLDQIGRNVISRFPGLDETSVKQMSEWYESLIDMMRREEVTEKGHLQMNVNIIGQLAQLNNQILADPRPRFDAYRAEFYRTLPYIVELRGKAGENKAGEIETCFNALYGVLLLRLQNKEISPDTQAAITQISKFTALLAKCFHLDEDDRLFSDEETENKQPQE